MKISTRGRYGLRALVDMAAHDNKGVISLTQIAARQNISLNYLEQVFAMLRRARIVRSVKGANGGYVLCKDMDELTICEILEALEGEFSIVDGDYHKAEGDPVRAVVSERIWSVINSSVEELLKERTLGDLVRRYDKIMEES